MCSFCEFGAKISGSNEAIDREFVNSMMANGVNTKDCKGLTPLHHAIQKNLPEMVEILIENGADTKIGQSPFELAVLLQQYQVVELLLKSYDINELKSTLNTNFVAFTVLHFDDGSKMAKLLFDHGFLDPNDESMVSWMQLAIPIDRQDWVRLFLNHGFEIDKVIGPSGKTGLHEAVNLRNLEIAQLFIQHGASLRSRNSDGNTTFEHICILLAGGGGEQFDPRTIGMFKNIMYLESDI